jgi:catechol 2,3-dioxygenase-like lactoylglutathione lyase family enzyme
MSVGVPRTRGVSHVALNSGDMARTVEFYQKLGIPLVKTMTLPTGDGQHFFFDVGNDATLGYIWWNDEAAQPAQQGHDIRDGCMNHIAVHIDPADVQPWWDLLSSTDLTWAFMDHKADADLSVVCNDISKLDEDTFAASFYVQDPDGAQIEFTAWYPAWERIGNSDVPMSTRRADRKTEWTTGIIEVANKLTKV